MHRLRKKISKFWGFLRFFRKVVNASGLILAYPCSTCQDGNFDVAHDLIWNNFWKQNFFVKERRGDPLILKKISKFWGFLRLSRKVVYASGLILAYSCSTRQDGNFDVAHDLIWNNFLKTKFFFEREKGGPFDIKKNYYPNHVVCYIKISVLTSRTRICQN